MSSDGVNSYTWDRANRLLSMGGASYQYDGEGRRVQQTVSSVCILRSAISALSNLSIYTISRLCNSGSTPDFFIFSLGTKVLLYPLVFSS